MDFKEFKIINIFAKIIAICNKVIYDIEKPSKFNITYGCKLFNSNF